MHTRFQVVDETLMLIARRNVIGCRADRRVWIRRPVVASVASNATDWGPPGGERGESPPIGRLEEADVWTCSIIQFHYGGLRR